MRLLREPTRFLIIWTGLAVLLLGQLLPNLNRPVDPNCREWCTLLSDTATWLTGIVLIVWLVVSILAVLVWRGRHDR